MSRFALKLHRPARRGAPPSSSRLPLLVALLAAAIGGGVGASPAEAKEYRVYVCKAPDGQPIALDKSWSSWSQTQPNSLWGSAFYENCWKGGPIEYWMGLAGGPASYAAGAAAPLSFNVRWQGDLRFTGVTVNRSVESRANAADGWSTPEWLVSAGGKVVERCWASRACALGQRAPAPHVVSDVNWNAWGVEPSWNVDFAVRCEGPSDGKCVNDGTPRMVAFIHAIHLTVFDSASPQIADVGGTAYASGPQKGTRSLLVNASDLNGSGVREAVAYVDGREAARGTDFNGGTCLDTGLDNALPSYRGAVTPCKTSNVALDLAFDSSKFSDGAHRLKVVVSDAAGNTTSTAEHEVVFENFPPPSNDAPPTVDGPAGGLRPNDVLTARPGVWSGKDLTLSYQWLRSEDGARWDTIPKANGTKYSVTRGDIGFYLKVAVTATNIEGSTTAESVRTDKVQSGATIQPAGFGDGTATPESKVNGGGGDPSTAQLVLDREQRQVDVKHGAKIVVTGRLVDADNQPIANADVDVFEQLVLTAAAWTKIGTVKTDSQGGYVFRPKTTASRRLRFAFSDKRDEANYRATREVLVSVQGGMTIGAKRKVLKPGQTIRLQGRLTVDHLPKTGTWVEVQVLDSGVWRTIATRKTSSKGLWTFKHRLRQSAGITFRFRSRLRPVGDVASAETKSATLKVRVR